MVCGISGCSSLSGIDSTTGTGVGSVFSIGAKAGSIFLIGTTGVGLMAAGVGLASKLGSCF